MNEDEVVTRTIEVTYRLRVEVPVDLPEEELWEFIDDGQVVGVIDYAYVD